MTVAIAPGLEAIPGYRLTRRLGVGGFGEVWEAVHERGERFALKIVELSQKHGDEELSAIHLIAHLRHPHLLHLVGHWVSDDHLLIATELADGTTKDLFDEYRAEGKQGIPRTELISLLTQAAEALDYLNSAIHEFAGKKVAIQHRDVKPENIFILDSHVRVGDFGLVKVLERVSEPNSGKGTMIYAPPEVVEGQVTHTSDQYSLALTYCMLLTGDLPFAGETGLEKLWARMQVPPNLEKLPPVDRPIVGQALAKDPAKRFPSCGAFVRALARVRIEEDDADALRQSRRSDSLTRRSERTTDAGAARNAGSPSIIGRSARPLPAGFVRSADSPIHESGFPCEIVCEMDGNAMVLVPAGEFSIGPVRGNGTYRRSYVSTFFIDKYPTTNAQFQWFVHQAEYRRADRWAWGDDGAGLANRSAHPAVWLTWEDSLAYCQWSGKVLPTEAEWEKAARGLDGRIYPWGPEPFVRRSSGPKRTTPVGMYPDLASPFGCLDMVGNVWQWCADWFDEEPERGGFRNPMGPAVGAYRVLRGGSWANSADLQTTFFRSHLTPESRGPTIGFRGLLRIASES